MSRPQEIQTDTGMYAITRLKNGLTIATAEMPHMTSVSLGLWVGVGGRYEPAEVNGVCHFIEHLLFKGTKRRTARKISQDVEGIGGYLNAFTSEEMTCYHSKARHDRFDELLDVLTDMFLNSKFDRVEINKERSVIKEELAMYLDQPQHRVQELLNETLWPGQPLGRPLTGTEATLDSLTRSRLTDYQRHNYVANRTIFAAAGRLKHENIVKAVSRLANRFPQGAAPNFVPAAWRQSEPCVRLFTKQTEQTQMALGIRTCSRHDPRRYALRLLNTLLGENMSSRLFQVIREDRGLAYSIYSSLSYFDDAGSLTISAGLDVDNLTRTLKLVMRELGQLAATLPTTGELRRARDYVIGQIDLGLESTDNQMMFLGEQLVGYGKVISPDDIKLRISEVKPGEIRAAARDFFRPGRMNLALVSPLKTDRGLAGLLKV
jgi:predicted Zn-dependent peptidase